MLLRLQTLNHMYLFFCITVIHWGTFALLFQNYFGCTRALNVSLTNLNILFGTYK